jgi:membrane-associated PAP2 superfamily phosphatase
LQAYDAGMFYFCGIMLTEDEKKFIAYWEVNRLHRKKTSKQLAIGLPLGALIATAILLNFFSGWYKRADMVIRSGSSLILVLVIAALLIVVFTAVFSARHQWDINEQRYREFLAKKDQP